MISLAAASVVDLPVSGSARGEDGRGVIGKGGQHHIVGLPSTFQDDVFLSPPKSRRMVRVRVPALSSTSTQALCAPERTKSFRSGDRPSSCRGKSTGNEGRNGGTSEQENGRTRETREWGNGRTGKRGTHTG